MVTAFVMVSCFLLLAVARSAIVFRIAGERGRIERYDLWWRSVRGIVWAVGLALAICAFLTGQLGSVWAWEYLTAAAILLSLVQGTGAVIAFLVNRRSFWATAGGTSARQSRPPVGARRKASGVAH